MPTRRQEKIARVVKEVVSEAIAQKLSDPRLENQFVSVTRVKVAADLKSAEVFFSIFQSKSFAQKNNAEQKKYRARQNRTFEAVLHARKYIQSMLAKKLKSKFCPVLKFQRDEKFKESLQTLKLLNKISNELKIKDEFENDPY